MADIFLTNSLINRGRKLKDLNMAVDDSAAHKDTLPGFHSWYRRKLQSYRGSSWFVFCGRLNKCKINCKWSLMCVSVKLGLRSKVTCMHINLRWAIGTKVTSCRKFNICTHDVQMCLCGLQSLLI